MQSILSPAPNVDSVTLAEIRIKNLRLRTLIGFNPDEREKPQDVIVNARLWCELAEAAATDDVSRGVNYKRITKAMIAHVEGNRFLLLERLTQELLTLVLDFNGVLEAEIEVDKPHALRFADSVSVCLRGGRADRPGA